MSKKEREKEIKKLYNKIRENTKRCIPALKSEEKIIATDYTKEKGKEEQYGHRVSIPKDCNIVCYDIIEEQEVTDATFKTEDWYNEYKKSKIKVLSKDPYDKDKQTNWDVRYFATLVHKLYPPEYITRVDEFGNEYKDYINKFHIRGLYYRLISTGACIPFKKKNEYILRRMGKTKEFYNRIGHLITLARYANLIPYEQIMDFRVREGIKTEFFPNVKNAKEDTGETALDIKIEFNPVYKPEYEGILILIYVEKKEIFYVFEELARNYNIAYYIGMGQVSLTTIKNMYDFIKKYTKFAIVLCVTDYDISGFDSATSIARRFQYLIDEDPDKDKPAILVHRWLISPIEYEEIYEIAQKEGIVPIEGLLEIEYEEETGVPPSKARKKALKGKYICELDALELLVGKKTSHSDYSHTTRLYQIYEIKLKQLFKVPLEIQMEDKSFISNIPLIYKPDYDSLYSKVEDEIKNKINHELTKIKIPETSEFKKYLPDNVTIDNYIKAIENWIKNTVEYNALKKAIDNVIKTTPIKDIKFKTDNIDFDKFISDINKNIDKLLSNEHIDVMKELQEPILNKDTYENISKMLKNQKSYQLTYSKLLKKPDEFGLKTKE